MRLMSSIAACILVLMLLQSSSCTRYIDKVTGKKSLQVMQGSITYYPDSNILIYRSNVGLSMDTMVLKPKPFYAKLPKDLVWSSMTNSQSFVFNYPRQQVVSIYIDLAFSTSVKDTTYVPHEAEMYDLINRSTLSYNKKYDIRKIRFIPRRKQLVIKKGAATILLYDITSEKFSTVSEYLKEFRFL